MDVRVLISMDEYETRAAVLENSVLTEYLLERNDHRRTAGNIYKGRVCSIVPGMQASFVDIGLGRNAFLFVADAGSPTWPPSYPGFADLEEESLDPDEEADEDEDLEDEVELPKPTIQDLMKEGQEIIVQMDKEPIGAKGARVTANISLPGRYVVLLPNSKHVGVSRRISSAEEKARLREIGKEIAPGNAGLILRTAALGVSQEVLKSDVDALMRQWQRIKRAAEEARAPLLLHREMGLAHRILRDSLVEDTIEFVVDNRGLFQELREAKELLRPDLDCYFTLYEDRLPLFRRMGVEDKIDKILERKIWLDCGGYIVIDEAEALTAIDVNTGKYVGDFDLEETVLTTNLEASAEIAYQLRLRNIGGIIIVDYIDMKLLTNWDLVVQRLGESLKRDRAYTKILGVTELGLVEMTRKRVHKSLSRSLGQPCPYCKREGMILSLQSMVIKALRRLEFLCKEIPDKVVTLYLHPEVAAAIKKDNTGLLDGIENRTGKTVEVYGCESMHFEEMRQKPLASFSEALVKSYLE